MLSLNAGRVLTFQFLLRQVSGKRCTHSAKGALRALVRNLRRRLGDDADDPVYIVTARSVGYRTPRPAGS